MPRYSQQDRAARGSQGRSGDLDPAFPATVQDTNRRRNASETSGQGHRQRPGPINSARSRHVITTTTSPVGSTGATARSRATSFDSQTSDAALSGRKSRDFTPSLDSDVSTLSDDRSVRSGTSDLLVHYALPQGDDHATAPPPSEPSVPRSNRRAASDAATLVSSVATSSNRARNYIANSDAIERWLHDPVQPWSHMDAARSDRETSTADGSADAEDILLSMDLLDSSETLKLPAGTDYFAQMGSQFN